MQFINHPLKVLYREGGRHFILSYYTHEDQNKLIIAKLEQALLHTAKLAFERHDYVEPKELLEIDIVAPNEQICLNAVKAFKKEYIETFLRGHIAPKLDMLVKNSMPLPKQFTVCKKYNPSNEGLTDEEWLSRCDSTNDRVYHFDCLDCFCGYTLVGISEEELFDQYSPNSYFNIKKYHDLSFPIDNNYGYSIANPSNPNKDLFLAKDFSYGIDLCLHENVMIDSCFFYYHLIRELDIAPYVAIVAESEISRKEKRLQKETRQQELYKQKELSDLKKFISVFEE